MSGESHVVPTLTQLVNEGELTVGEKDTLTWNRLTPSDWASNIETAMTLGDTFNVPGPS